MFPRRRPNRDEKCPPTTEVVVPIRPPRRDPTPPEIQAFGRQLDDAHAAVRAAHVYTDVLRSILETACVRSRGDDRDALRRLPPTALRQVVSASTTFEQTVNRALEQIDKQLAAATRGAADLARYPAHREEERT